MGVGLEKVLRALLREGLLVCQGFPSPRGSPGQVPPGDVMSPDSGAGGRASRAVTRTWCLAVTESPGWGRGARVDGARSDLSEAFAFLPPDILIKTCIRRN